MSIELLKGKSITCWLKFYLLVIHLFVQKKERIKKTMNEPVNQAQWLERRLRMVLMINSQKEYTYLVYEDKFNEFYASLTDEV